MSIRLNTTADWGMPPTSRRYDFNRNDPGICIHYPGPGSFRFEQHQRCLEQVKAWDQQHRNRGSLALEYGCVVCQHGFFIPARSTWDRMLARPGSNGSAYANGEAISIQFMAGTGDRAPNDQEYQWIGEVAARAVSQGCRPVITGHRDWFATACPGDPIYSNLATIKKYTLGGTPPPEPIVEDDDMAVVVVQGSKARLISGSLVAKVDSIEQWRNSPVPVVNVTSDDIDRITAAAAKTAITSAPKVGGFATDLDSSGRAAAVAAFLIVVLMLGVAGGMYLADQLLMS